MRDESDDPKPPIYTVRLTAQFERNAAAHDKHPDMDRETFLVCVDRLARGLPMEGPENFRDHALESRQRNWAGYREFHLGPDLLVIYRIVRGVLVFRRLGTHAELFGSDPS